MTSIRDGNSTPRTCFRCFALTKYMKNCTNAGIRTLAATDSVMDEHERLKLDAKRFRGTDVAKEKRQKAKDLLKGRSLLGIRPVLYQFPFVRSSPDLELFQIYLFEPLHNLSLGVSKMLKQACFERMSATNLQSSVMKDANGEPKAFSSIRAVVLSAANEIMSKMKQEQPIRGLNIDYSKGEVSCNYNGFFTKDGIVGMLEGKELQALDMVFPFIGAFLDRICGETDSCQVTTVFTLYSDIVMISARRNMPEGWKKDELESLREKIKMFKKRAVEVFKTYQSSEMGTLKFHLLDHLVDDLERVESYTVLDAGLYEYTHVFSKRAYRRTSKKRSHVMIDCMTLFRGQEPYFQNESIANDRAIFQKKTRNEQIGLVQRGEKTTFQDLKHARRLHRKCRLEGKVPSKETLEPSRKVALEIARDIGEDGTVVLLYHLGEKMRDGMVIVRVNQEKALVGLRLHLNNL